MLLDLTAKESRCGLGFQAAPSGPVMETLDAVNARFGRGALRLAGPGPRPGRACEPKPSHLAIRRAGRI